MGSSQRYQANIHHTLLELIEGDITLQETAAIVNAANSSLLGGGGVDGAIHRAAGPKLLEETKRLGGCETGNAKLTKGYNLRARYVIHAVGPVYRSHDPLVPKLLASAFRRSLEVAVEHQISSIAFPAISTGIYGYPLHEAAPIALNTVIDFVAEQEVIKVVRFVLYSAAIREAFADTLEDIMATKNTPS